jgi:hypothetical protein
MLKVKVFSATMARDREFLGEKISDWLAANQLSYAKVKRLDVNQSSDEAFHCLSIIIWWE